MRVRSGNPYDEMHGKTLRIYEFVADGMKSAGEITSDAEVATGLRFTGDPAGQDGFILTRKNPDGSRFVAIVLYEACGSCGGHSVPHRRAADISAVKQVAIKAAIGEHPQHRLIGAPTDAATLRALGFTGNDPALRP